MNWYLHANKAAIVFANLMTVAGIDFITEYFNLFA